MEQFMDMSSNFMDSINLQNGVFEEQGIKMLEEYEKKSALLLMGDSSETLDLNQDVARPEQLPQNGQASDNYENLFDCLLYTSPSPRDQRGSRMPSSA